jgi:hypothetical protein
MAEPPQFERLDSWKEIADYLGRDVRTAMRWEKTQGLPVRRVPGGPGRSVFAYAAEIDVWLKATPAQGFSASSPDLPPASTNVRSRWLLAVAAVLGLVAIGVWIGLPPPAHTGDLTIKLTPTAVVAVTPEGAEKWRYSFPSEDKVGFPDWAWAVVGGRDPAVYVATSTRFRGGDVSARSGQVLALTHEGKLTRTFEFTDRRTFAGRSYGAPWVVSGIKTNDGGGARRIAVSGHHYEWWPGLVTVLDERFQRRSTFVNAGWIESVHWLSPNRLLVAGFSTAQDSGMVTLLDAGTLDGQSPEPPGSPYHCDNCGAGRPIRYVVMRRSELNRVTGSPFNAAVVGLIGERVTVRTVEVRPEAAVPADALYEFTPGLDLLAASFSDRYWDLHRSLELRGVVTHQRDQCPDRDGPGGVLVWGPDTGWRSVAPPRR